MAESPAGGESTIEVDYLGSMAYKWTFQVPPRSRLVQLLSFNENALKSGDLKFVNGPLGNIEHGWEFQPSLSGGSRSTRLNVGMCLWIKSSPDYFVKVQKWELHMFEGNRLRKKITFKPRATNSQDYTDYTPRQGFENWVGYKDINRVDWDDSVDSIRVVFNIQCEQNGKIMTLPRCSESAAISALNPKEMNAEQFFLSELLSDVVMVAGGQEFPAHRFILACKSPVFHRMFQNSMKESLEGRVVIDDMEPTALKEMLYFIYHGEFTNSGIPNGVCVDLFKSAEKYELQALKQALAKQIANAVTFENALDVYGLGESFNEKILMDTAEEVLKMNKTKGIQDPKMLVDATSRFPQLVFNIFSS